MMLGSDNTGVGASRQQDGCSTCKSFEVGDGRESHVREGRERRGSWKEESALHIYIASGKTLKIQEAKPVPAWYSMVLTGRYQYGYRIARGTQERVPLLEVTGKKAEGVNQNFSFINKNGLDPSGNCL